MALYKTDNLLVAAIDFGTTYSGYAFSLRHDYEKDPTRIKANATWIAGEKTLASLKTPTCVLLKPNGEFEAFGYQAENQYTSLADHGEHHDWMFFRRFKMTLFENMKLKRGYVIKDVSGRHELPAKTVFAHGIRYLKNHLSETLRKQGISDLIKDDMYVTWVLTVPAIWDDGAKQFMREAADEAGILESQLRLALEPEAAALYCRVLPVDMLHGCDNFNVFQPGTEYMVLDLGGGTVDVTIQRVLADGNLKEIHKASGGAWGGTKVDESFSQLLYHIAGNDIMDEFKSENTGDEMELFREFETKKRTINPESDSKIQTWIPASLASLYADKHGEPIKTAVKKTEYKGKVSWTGDKMRVNSDIMKSLFAKPADSIVKHVQELLQHPKCANVDTIIMVGGFSECPVIQDAVKTNFSNLRIIIPDDAGLAVVKGAVLFGHSPTTIVSRKTKFTYGVGTSRDFRPGDPLDKKFMVDGKEKCRDSYSRHVRVNKSVVVDKFLEPQIYTPLYANSKQISIPIYISTEEDPKYTTDVSCRYLGKLLVPLPPNATTDTEVEVKMAFGGTELTVQAEEKMSHNVLKASFDFLSKDN